MNQQLIYMVSYSIIASLSALASLLMLILHVKIKKLQKHPGGLVLAQCITQFLFDIHWYSGFPHIQTFLNDTLRICKVLGAVNSYIFFLSWNYLLCLSIEIIIKITNRASISHKKRMKFYHLTSHLVSIFIVIIAASLGDLGISTMQTCFIKEHGYTGYLMYTPIIVHLPFMWTSVIVTLRNINHTYAKVLFNYALVILSLSLSLSISLLFFFIDSFIVDNNSLNISGAIFGSMTGLLVACSRLWNKKLIEEIRRRFWKKKLNSPTQSELESEESNLSLYFLGDMFSDLNSRIIMQMIVLVILRYQTTTEYDIEADHQSSSKKIKSRKTAKFNFPNEQIQYLCSSLGFKFAETHRNRKIQLIEYRPHTFAVIRNKLGYSSEVLLSILYNRINFSIHSNKIYISGGRSDSFIFNIANDNFIIKTILEQEKKTFVKSLLLPYSKRILENDESRLVRILGVFKLIPLNQNFLIMENIVPFRKNAIIFDLKGSTVDRRGLNSGPNVTYKDEDFLNNPIQLNICPSDKEELFRIIKNDMKIFRAAHIMDYSLLFGVYSTPLDTPSRYSLEGLDGEFYVLGVIDFFQLYDCRKKTERNVKVILRHKPSNHISVVSPDLYYTRILNFLKNMLQI